MINRQSSEQILTVKDEKQSLKTKDLTTAKRKTDLDEAHEKIYDTPNKRSAKLITKVADMLKADKESQGGVEDGFQMI